MIYRIPAQVNGQHCQSNTGVTVQTLQFDRRVLSPVTIKIKGKLAVVFDLQQKQTAVSTATSQVL
jgi:hypothetical protein